MRRLATAIYERMTELGLTQEDVAQAGGPSTTRLRQIDAIANRGGRVIGFKPHTLRNLDTALRWEQGSASDVLAGGNPRPLPGPAVLRGENGKQGTFVVVPPELADALAKMSPAERAEAEARMVAEGFKALREFRSHP